MIKYEFRKAIQRVEVHRQRLSTWGFKMGLGGLVHSHCLLPYSSDPSIVTIKRAPSSPLGALSLCNCSHEALFWVVLTWLWVLSRREITQIHQVRITNSLSTFMFSQRAFLLHRGSWGQRLPHFALFLLGTIQLFLLYVPHSWKKKKRSQIE